MSTEEFDALRRHVDERNSIYQASLTHKTPYTQKLTLMDRLTARIRNIGQSITRKYRMDIR